MPAARVNLRLLGAVLLLLIAPGLAHAQVSGNVDRLKVDLYGNNVDKAVVAASALGSLKKDEARDALWAAMHLGAPVKLLTAMLEALGLHKSEATLGLLRQYARYRNPEVRVVALKAIGQVEGKKATKDLIDALGDGNPMVRARAARILGERRERSAEPALFRMLMRGDGAAAAPLGQVGGVQTALNCGDLFGELPDRAVSLCLGEMVKRKDFGPDPLRTQMITALCRIPGADATAALVEYVASIPESEQRQSKELAERCVKGRVQ